MRCPRRCSAFRIARYGVACPLPHEEEMVSPKIVIFKLAPQPTRPTYLPCDGDRGRTVVRRERQVAVAKKKFVLRSREGAPTNEVRIAVRGKKAPSRCRCLPDVRAQCG